MPFEISVVRTFSAAHQLRLYDGSTEPVHGHNWRIEVTVAAEELDSIGVVMDFHELERRLAPLVGSMHNTHLNDSEAFQTLNPSTEHVALHIGQQLRLPANVRLVRVQVWETADNTATYLP